MEKGEKMNQVSGANMQADVKEVGSSSVHISLSEDYRLLAVDDKTPPYPYSRIDFTDSRWRMGDNFFSVYVVSLELPNRAYVQLSPYNTNKVLDLVEEYEKKDLEKQKNVEWPRDVGSPCFAYYTDGSLYRAYIMEYVDSNRRKIRYVDFGNCDVVQIKDIFQIPGNFLAYPEGATLCSVVDLMNAAVLNEGKLKNFLEFKDFKCKMVCATKDTTNQLLVLISLFDEISEAPVKDFLDQLEVEAKNENVVPPAPEQIQEVKSSELGLSSANTNANGQAEICDYVNTVVIKPMSETQVEAILNEKCVPEIIVEQEEVVEKKEGGPEEVAILIETNEKVAEPEPTKDKENELLIAKPNPEVIVVKPDVQQTLEANKGQQEPQKLVELEKVLLLSAAKPNPELIVVVQPDVQQTLVINKGQQEQEPQKVAELEKVLSAAKPNPEVIVVVQPDVQRTLDTNKNKGQQEPEKVAKVEKVLIAVQPNPEVVQPDFQKSKSLDTTTTTTKGKEQVKVNLRPAAEAKRKIATTMPTMSEPQEVILDLQPRPRRQFLSKTSSSCVVAADFQKENTKPLAPTPMIIIQNEIKTNGNVLELEPPRKMQKYINKATFTDIFNNPPRDQVSLDALDGHGDGPQPTSASKIASTSTSTTTHDAQKQAEIKTPSKIYVVTGWDKTIKKCEEQHDRILEACIKHQEKILKATEEHEQKWNNELRDYQTRYSQACDENRDWIKKEQAAFAQELASLTGKLNNIYENVKKCEIPNVVDE